jgi:hypothetical protein
MKDREATVMKDMGMVHGGAAQAVPVVVGKDTVYVHTDIRPAPPDAAYGDTGLFEYREIQYGKDEWLQLMAGQAGESRALLDIILGAGSDG